MKVCAMLDGALAGAASGLTPQDEECEWQAHCTEACTRIGTYKQTVGNVQYNWDASAVALPRKMLLNLWVCPDRTCSCQRGCY
eukprot:375201-Amphidinium_carterae.1